MPEVLQATVLVAALSTILSIVLLMIEPTEVQNAFSAFSTSPLPLFIVQVATFLGMAGMVTYVGRLFQGHATYKESLTALVWMQVVLFGVSMVQLVLGLVAPFLAPILFLASMMIMIHLIVNFIMELHGFKNILFVIAGIVGTFFALAVFFTIILSMLGLAPEVV
ncbi:MAG: hypothetical protein JKX71_01235 [Amylibacter sp.]|nr:hypothetical protein [Amylibacter sp.]